MTLEKQKKMNILHLSAVKNWGGGENHIENLCAELKTLAPEVQNHILCIKNAQFQQKLNGGNYEVVPASLAFKMDPRYFLKLIKVCRKKKIDLIHIHDTTALTLCVMGDYLYNLPPFIFSKKTSFPIKDRKSTIYKYNYPKIKKILCVSEATRNITSEKIKNKQQLTTIYHGTRLETKNKEAAFSLRNKLNISKEQKIIGNIANHIRAKSLDTLIDVADFLINKKGRKDFYFVQIGTFTKRTTDLQQKLEQLKLQEYFAFLDFVPNAWSLIPQFDLSLVTSQSEGVPGVIYESFYYKIPVVSTNVGGITEVIENQKNGLLAPKHDFETLGKHITYLSENSDLVQQFTEVSYKKLVENFTTKTMAEKTLAEYKKIINGRS